MIPEVLIHVSLIAFAMLLLAKGADWTVEGALAVARRFELSDVVVGATVVALGTSAPEMVVTIVAALLDEPNISVGNVVGSNIFNMGFILGGVAAVWSLPVPRGVAYRDAPLLLGVSLLLAGALLDLRLARWEGLGMFVLLVAYLTYLVRRGESPLDAPEPEEATDAGAREFALLALGLVGIIAGAHLLVQSASELARGMGVPDWAIGVTVVAAGTSLPELVTAVASARRGRTGVMAGMLIGSDCFNMLGVLGLAALIRPLTVGPQAGPSVWMMIGMLLALLVFMRSGFRLSRLEGALLVLMAAGRWYLDLAPRG